MGAQALLAHPAYFLDRHGSARADAPRRPGATFPAGALSGAQPRAIQLIDDFEPTARGVYGGVVGYFDLSGDADLAIAIRTASLKDGVASVQAGAGVVADSVPRLSTSPATRRQPQWNPSCAPRR